MGYNWDPDILRKINKMPAVMDELGPDFFDDKCKSETFSKEETLKMDYEFLSNVDFIYPTIEKVITQRVKTIVPQKFSKKMSIDEALEYTHAFYQTTDAEIKNIFNGFFAKITERLKIVPSYENSNFVGKTFFTSILKDCFICMVDLKSIRNFEVAVHEIAHACAFILKDYTYRSYSAAPYSEIESFFIVLIALDFLEKQTLYAEECRKLRAKLYIDFIDASIQMGYKFMINAQYHQTIRTANEMTTRKFIYHCRKLLGISKAEMKYVFSDPADEVIQYSYSMIIAAELYEIYQTDPERAFYLFKEIIKSPKRAAANIDKQIHSLGLIPGENVDILLRKLGR